jgi:hypothetical protein
VFCSVGQARSAIAWSNVALRIRHGSESPQWQHERVYPRYSHGLDVYCLDDDDHDCGHADGDVVYDSLAATAHVQTTASQPPPPYAERAWASNATPVYF